MPPTKTKNRLAMKVFSSSRCKNGLKQITLLSPTLRFKVKKIRHYLFRHFDARPPVNTGRWSKSQAIVVNIALFEVINWVQSDGKQSDLKRSDLKRTDAPKIGYLLAFVPSVDWKCLSRKGFCSFSYQHFLFLTI